jgi:hypothetical protein
MAMIIPAELFFAGTGAGAGVAGIVSILSSPHTGFSPEMVLGWIAIRMSCRLYNETSEKVASPGKKRKASWENICGSRPFHIGTEISERRAKEPMDRRLFHISIYSPTA